MKGPRTHVTEQISTMSSQNVQERCSHFLLIHGFGGGQEMGFGTEVLMAVVGLWGLFLRPWLVRFAAEMVDVLQDALRRTLSGRPFVIFSTYLPHSSSLLSTH
ncbi:unnamed protein product [Victoria cruziana]